MTWNEILAAVIMLVFPLYVVYRMNQIHKKRT